jgi:hypothetical protein
MTEIIEDRFYIAYTLNDITHRSNGFAVFCKSIGTGYWCLFGKRHRYYGPATYMNDWYIHGKFIMGRL